MLQDIVEAAVKAAINRKLGPQASRSWLPYNLSPEDVSQEAWVAVLEAVEGGVVEQEELQRLAEGRINALLQRSARQAGREIPAGDLIGDEPAEDDYSEDSFP